MRSGIKEDVWLPILLITVLGGIPRFFSLFTNFWTDEVGSWVIAQNADFFFDIFKVHDVNNHLLNTFYLYLLGEQSHWIPYRLLSFILGTASITLAGMIGGARSKHDAVIASLLFAASFQMVLYSSEARGYGPAIFFALLCFLLLLKGEPKSQLHAFLFNASAMLGLLSHLTFVVIFVSFFLCACMHVLRGNRKHTWRSTIQWYAAPALLLVLILLNLSQNPLHLGWDIRYRFLHSLQESITVPLGAPENVIGIAVSLLSIMSIGILALHKLHRVRDPLFFLFLPILISPFFLLLFGVLHQAWGARFIVLSIAFFYLLASSLLSDISKKGQWGRVATTALLGAFILSNGWNVGHLLATGRGQYLHAFTRIIAETEGEEVHIGSKSFSTFLLLQFYEPYLLKKHYRVDLVGKKESEISTTFLLKGTKVERHLGEEKSAPPWFILEDRYHRFNPGDGELRIANTTYTFQKLFPYFRESGHDWFLYKRSSSALVQDREDGTMQR